MSRKMAAYKPLEFPKGHPIHEVPLHGKDQFGRLPKKNKEETLCEGSKSAPYCGHSKRLHNGKRESCTWGQGEHLCWCERFMPPKQKKQKAKPAWELKHRKTKKVNYWCIDYQNGLVFVVLGLPTPTMRSFWGRVVRLLNVCNVTAMADLSMFGIN